MITGFDIAVTYYLQSDYDQNPSLIALLSDCQSLDTIYKIDTKERGVEIAKEGIAKEYNKFKNTNIDKDNIKLCCLVWDTLNRFKPIFIDFYSVFLELKEESGLNQYS